MSAAKSPPTSAAEPRRRIPAVDRLLRTAALAPLAVRYPRSQLVAALRAVLAELRAAAQASELADGELSDGVIARRVEARLTDEARPFYRRVINATGVVLHTGLGRAPLAGAAVDAVVATAGGAQRLELDLASGERGGRDHGCAELLVRLLGCEAATVVNNNAAATLLILAALARGKRVLLARGEMVEIGGSYRIPEILRESGAHLVEVGTTNRTHERDYRDALDEETGLILKVHTSNYRVVGFIHEVDVATLAALGRERGVPVVHDLGSGALVDLQAHGLPAEPLPRAALAAGADLVCFSGDKLLGGPQAGIIAGRRGAVEQCRRHPLFRALRPGRLIYTALEATLRLYLGGDAEALRRVPALRALAADAAELRRRARAAIRRLRDLPDLEVAAVACAAQAGSGALPARDVDSWGIRVTPRRTGADELAEALRTGEPAILARVQDGAVLLDLRTVAAAELPAVEARLRQLAGGEAST